MVAASVRKASTTGAQGARRPEPERDSVVYDGGRRMGDIQRQADGFVARAANGRKIGLRPFATSREAMKAICAADRAAREAELASA